MMKKLLKILLIISISLFLSCYLKKDQLINNKSGIISIDKKFFSNDRIKKEYINFENQDPLKIKSIEELDNNSIRLLFSHPLFYDNEIGKEFNNTFIYFDPPIEGKFLVRTGRILDLIPQPFKLNNYTMVIPANLVGIEGNKMKEQIKIPIIIQTDSINNKPMMKFDIDIANKDKEKQNINILIAKNNDLINPVENINFTNKYSPLIQLLTSIDLETNHKNEFIFVNIYSIKRSYLKIDKEDVSFLIKNINSLKEIKKHFLSKKLLDLPLIVADKNNGDIHTANYIPASGSGLYFCYQKVYLNDKNSKEFFQVYNFCNKRINGIDTENSIIIYSDYLKKETNQKIELYSSEGEIFFSGFADEEGFCKVKNSGYSAIYALSNGISNYLFKIQLNDIKKEEYNIFTNYDDSDPGIIKINGILLNRDGSQIKNIRSLKFILKAVKNGKSTLNKEIKDLNNNGIFNISFNNNLKNQEDIYLDFIVNNRTVKKYKLNLLNNDSEFFKKNTHKNDILKIREDAVFFENPVFFTLDKESINNIDSIYYYWKTNNEDKKEEKYKGNISEIISIPVPGYSGINKINFEILLKNGDSLKQNFTINKINISKNKNYIVNHHGFNDSDNSINYNIYNPFDSFDSYLLLYNNDVRYYKKINLKKGFNLITIEKNKINYPNLKVLVILEDLKNNNRVFILNRLFIDTDFSSKINAKISEKSGSIQTETDINKNDFINKNIFINTTSTFLNTDPIFDSLYKFNDFINKEDEINKIIPGKNIKINNDFKNIINLKKLNNLNYKLWISLYSTNKEIYNCSRNILNKSIIDIDLMGPDNFNISDKPIYKLNIQNISDNNLDIETEILSDNGIIDQKNKKITLIKGQSNLIDFTINNFRKEIPINLTINIYSQKELIKSYNKKITLHESYIYKNIEISGNISGNRASKSFINIPDNALNEFSIDLIISRNKYISLLKKNQIIPDLKNNFFEYNLLDYLDKYLEKKYLSDDLTPEFINDFYINERGIKKIKSDRKIDLYSTFIYLFASKYIPELFNQTDVYQIINDIIKNYKNNIILSSFMIFVLAEYGYYFDVVNQDFLNKIKNTNESILYYRYFKKNNMNINYKNLKADNDVFFRDYRLQDQFYQILKYYFEIENIDQSYINSYSYLIESIFLKIILLNKIDNDNSNSKNLEVVFKSPQLGDFKESLNNNEIIFRKYYYKYTDNAYNKKKLYEFTINKDSNYDLYYLIQADYKSPIDLINKNNKLEIYGEWLDQHDNILNKNNLELNIGETYYINTYIISNKNIDHIILKPINSYCLNIDYNNILINNEIFDLIDSSNKYIIIPKLKEGINVIKYQIIPKFTGSYKVNGNLIFDIYNFKNNLGENNLMLKVK